MSETALCNQCICLFVCAHPRTAWCCSPPLVFSRASPQNPVSAEQGWGCCLYFFFPTKDNKGSNEESANFFPFPLKMQTDSVDLDGTGRASEGLWGREQGWKKGPISNHHVEWQDKTLFGAINILHEGVCELYYIAALQSWFSASLLIQSSAVLPLQQEVRVTVFYPVYI